MQRIHAQNNKQRRTHMHNQTGKTMKTIDLIRTWEEENNITLTPQQAISLGIAINIHKYS